MGAIASPAVDGEVWTFYSRIQGWSKGKTLKAGQKVTFTYETPGFLQDGYSHRAVSVEPG